MWTLVVIGREQRCRDRVAESLEGLDRRLRVIVAADLGEAAVSLRTPGVTLAVVAEPGSPERMLGVLVALRARFPEVPVVVEVPAELPLVALQALGMGAADCLKRPVAPWEWRARCASLIDGQRGRRLIGGVLRRAATRIRRYAGDYVASAELVTVLTRANVFRDAVTGLHERRTGRIARLIAEALGLEDERCGLVEAGAGLHDIGKVGIPDRILHKSGRFTPEDRSVMRGHPEIGHRILKEGASATLHLSAEIALSHHERWDGSGYPRGLAREDIPLAGRIVAVADVLEAMTGTRGYRRGLPLEEGMAHVRKRSGRDLNSDCVEALLSRRDAVARVVGAA